MYGLKYNPSIKNIQLRINVFLYNTLTFITLLFWNTFLHVPLLSLGFNHIWLPILPEKKTKNSIRLTLSIKNCNPMAKLHKATELF